MHARISLVAAITLVTASVWTVSAQAHCDTLDGPVVSTARKALETGNVSPALAWVQKRDEGEIRTAFQKALNVRKTGGKAKELADSYFFETLVRVHRVGEGATYTGLKAAGTIEPPIAAADKAIATGRLRELAQVIAEHTEDGLHRHFDEVMTHKTYDPNDVEAGRSYSKAYVEFVHYAERLYNAAETLAPEAVQKPLAIHTH